RAPRSRRSIGTACPPAVAVARPRPATRLELVARNGQIARGNGPPTDRTGHTRYQPAVRGNPSGGADPPGEPATRFLWLRQPSASRATRITSSVSRWTRAGGRVSWALGSGASGSRLKSVQDRDSVGRRANRSIHAVAR